MKNRKWIEAITVGWAACALPLTGMLGEEAPLSAKPNIILILADDMGWGDSSGFGHPYHKTPRLDRLAEQGTDFRQFYVAGSACSPSRAGLLTGHHPARYRIYSGIALAPGWNLRTRQPDWLDPNAPSYARALRDAGYHTVHLGKWHLTGEDGQAVDAPDPSAYGFEEWSAMRGPATEAWLPRSGMQGRLTERAVEFLKQDHDRPFVLNFWIHEPHVPHLPSEASLELHKDLDERKRVYAAVISDMDHWVGRILDTLEETGLDENTIVIFTSDNGPAPRVDDPDAPMGKYYDMGSAGGLRGFKGELYEGGIRVPLIVRWPGRVPAGRVDETSVLAAVDFLPTFCAIAGADLPENWLGEGENILPALEGEEWRRSIPIFWKQLSPRPGRMLLGVRHGDWKLLMDTDGGHKELYNLIADHAEANNVAASYPEVISRLEPKLLDWVATLPEEVPAEVTSKTREGMQR